VLKMLMKHVISLIGWLRILMNVKLVVSILTSHLLASLIIPLLCVRFVIVLATIVILVLVIFLIIPLMNEQQIEFTNKVQEFDLS